ncbi:MAG: hypothetical protein ACI9VS_003801, partial [Candidatus Binatia bacterium]
MRLPGLCELIQRIEEIARIHSSIVHSKNLNFISFVDIAVNDPSVEASFQKPSDIPFAIDVPMRFWSVLNRLYGYVEFIEEFLRQKCVLFLPELGFSD